MILVKYRNSQASWSFKSEKWVSADKEFADILNRHLPDEDEISPSVPFRIGGMDKIVLDSAKDVFGKQLEVVSFLPGLAPEEKEGVVY